MEVVTSGELREIRNQAKLSFRCLAAQGYCDVYAEAAFGYLYSTPCRESQKCDSILHNHKHEVG